MLTSCQQKAGQNRRIANHMKQREISNTWKRHKPIKTTRTIEDQIKFRAPQLLPAQSFHVSPFTIKQYEY